MASASEIASVHGIGQNTSARLVSALELGRRLAVEVEDESPDIHNSSDAIALIQYDMSLPEKVERLAIPFARKSARPTLRTWRARRWGKPPAAWRSTCWWTALVQ